MFRQWAGRGSVADSRVLSTLRRPPGAARVRRRQRHSRAGDAQSALVHRRQPHARQVSSAKRPVRHPFRSQEPTRPQPTRSKHVIKSWQSSLGDLPLS